MRDMLRMFGVFEMFCRTVLRHRLLPTPARE